MVPSNQLYVGCLLRCASPSIKGVQLGAIVTVSKVERQSIIVDTGPTPSDWVRVSLRGDGLWGFKAYHVEAERIKRESDARQAEALKAVKAEEPGARFGRASVLEKKRVLDKRFVQRGDDPLGVESTVQDALNRQAQKQAAKKLIEEEEK